MIRGMSDEHEKGKGEPQKWQTVTHKVVDIPLEDCPFYRPGVKQAIGIGGTWELEFEDGHTETFYEDGAKETNGLA